MSARALRLAVVAILRGPSANGGLGLTQAECEVMASEQPPPRAGKRFVAVHGAGANGLSKDCLEEEYAVNVTVSFKTAGIPYDRWGTDLIDKEDRDFGLDMFCDRIKVAIHADCRDSRVIRKANEILGAATATPFVTATQNLFVEPLMYLGSGIDRIVGGDWFHGDPATGETGIVRTLRFGQAKRWQTLENMA